MSRLQHRILASVLTLTLPLIIECAGTIPPPIGVTESFFRELDGGVQSVAKYDFSRLQEGCGLCFFSYKMINVRKSDGTASDETGIRVWEYKFKDSDWDVKLFKRDMNAWGFRDIGTLFLTESGYKISVLLNFHRGRVVYGGRLCVDMNRYFTTGPWSEFHFDEDMQPWLDSHSQSLGDVKIDTVMMTVGY